MTKTTITPPLEGNVSRAVDFNLKKEDLMLLILEGKKEIMEQELSKLRNKVNEKEALLKQQQKAFEEEVKISVIKSFSKKLVTLISMLGSEKDIIIELIDLDQDQEYQLYKCYKVGEGAGAGYIKESRLNEVTWYSYKEAMVRINIGMSEEEFIIPGFLVPKVDMYRREQLIDLFKAELSEKHTRSLKGWKVLDNTAKELASLLSLLSDASAEYELFTRNQPRSKARMIKELLNRDAAGQQLLGNITAASKGVKLLS